MKYLFILGRNPELSLEEIKSYIKRTNNKIVDIEKKENSVLVELSDSLEGGAIDFFGGTIAIGIVICNVKDLDRKEVYMGDKNNFSYAIWNYSDSYEEISQYLKKRFKNEKLKASEKKLRNDLFSQDEDRMQRLSSKTVDEEYFVFGSFFGKIVQRCDYKKIEERDMKKPVRRESLSISPRLAKIMINLSEIRENETLLDGFCGVGVILIEALNQGIKVVGVDKDKKAISGAKENLNYFGFPKENYKLINENSSKVDLSEFSVNTMVSEPDFGEILRKIPTKEKAEEMIKRHEKIMFSVLNNVKNYMPKGGRFVFTSPYIKINSKKRVGCDLKNLAGKTGLKLAEGFPISEFRENQIVGRQIVVFGR